jgi:hypothetical protein
MRPSMQLEELHAEIVNQLEQLVKSETGLEKRLRWFKQQHQTPGLTALGIRTPTVRKLIHGFMNKFQ